MFRLDNYYALDLSDLGGFLADLCSAMQRRQHIIDGKKVEAKAAVPRNSGSGNSLTKKMFVGGTVRPGNHAQTIKQCMQHV